MSFPILLRMKAYSLTKTCLCFPEPALSPLLQVQCLNNAWCLGGLSISKTMTAGVNVELQLTLGNYKTLLFVLLLEPPQIESRFQSFWTLSIENFKHRKLFIVLNTLDVGLQNPNVQGAIPYSIDDLWFWAEWLHSGAPNQFRLGRVSCCACMAVSSLCSLSFAVSPTLETCGLCAIAPDGWWAVQ